MICPGGLHEMDQPEPGIYHCPLDGVLLITHSAGQVSHCPLEADQVDEGSPCDAVDEPRCR